MPSTFLDLTNQLLRKFNEVELTESTFVGARGIQSRAKDAIRNTVNKINQTAWNWPFNAKETTITVVPGQEQYTWPLDFMRAEWESFFVQADSTFNINYRQLQFIDRQDYYEEYAIDDDAAGTAGRNVPQAIYPSHGNGFGITPSPDKPYKIKYRYWSNPLALQNPLDQVTIPTQFDYVIISGAAVDMHDFYDNAEAAGLMRQQYGNDLSLMRNLLLNNYKALRDTRINFGGRSTGRMFTRRVFF